MKKPYIIIVTGAPCTGKTTLAEYLALRLRLPLLTKDGYKEVLFDTLGFNRRHLAKTIRHITQKVLMHTLEKLLGGQGVFILEANFRPKFDNKTVSKVLNNFKPKILQIFLFAQKPVILQRFTIRSFDPKRHEGHCDILHLRQLERDLDDNVYKPLQLNSKLVRLDTSKGISKKMFENMLTLAKKWLKV